MISCPILVVYFDCFVFWNPFRYYWFYHTLTARHIIIKQFKVQVHNSRNYVIMSFLHFDYSFTICETLQLIVL